MDLLAVYGAEFTPENIICNTDSSSVLIYTGDMMFSQCVKSCHDLGNNWSIPSRMEFFRFDLAELQNGESWINSIGLEAFPPLALLSYAHYIQTGYSGAGNLSYYVSESEYHCYCFNEERPKVEYSYCRGEYPTDPAFQDCANEKVTTGWYPIGGIETDAGSDPHQAFWRWAE